jgi:hypothetical protein
VSYFSSISSFSTSIQIKIGLNCVAFSIQFYCFIFITPQFSRFLYSCHLQVSCITYFVE